MFNKLEISCMLHSNCISIQSYYQNNIINKDVTELYVFFYRQYVQSFFSMPLFFGEREEIRKGQ